MTDDKSSKTESIPDWVPTVAVERLARECQKPGTIEVSTKVLGSLLLDLLKHRQDAIEKNVAEIRASLRSPPARDDGVYLQTCRHP